MFAEYVMFFEYAVQARKYLNTVIDQNLSFKASSAEFNDGWVLLPT